jgi:hypothetical protein
MLGKTFPTSGLGTIVFGALIWLSGPALYCFFLFSALLDEAHYAMSDRPRRPKGSRPHFMALPALFWSSLRGFGSALCYVPLVGSRRFLMRLSNRLDGDGRLPHFLSPLGVTLFMLGNGLQFLATF